MCDRTITNDPTMGYVLEPFQLSTTAFRAKVIALTRRAAHEALRAFSEFELLKLAVNCCDCFFQRIQCGLHIFVNATPRFLQEGSNGLLNSIQGLTAVLITGRDLLFILNMALLRRNKVTRVLWRFDQLFESAVDVLVGLDKRLQRLKQLRILLLQARVGLFWR